MGLTTTYNPEVIIEHFSAEMKDVLQEELMLDQRIKWVTDFPDGDKLTIPTLSELNVRDYAEGDEISLDDANTGKFELAIDKYYQVGFSITDKMKEDSWYVNQLLSNFTGKIVRALMEKKELDISALQAKQTAANANTINGAAHRLPGTGTSGAITINDIAKAKFALDKANVSDMGRYACVDPKNVLDLINEDAVIRQDVYGANSRLMNGKNGPSFLGKYLGFEFYESNMLQTDTGVTSIDGTTSVTDPAYNLFCGEEAFIGAMRSQPSIEFSRVFEKKSDAYHATIRYGLDLYRPEALVVVGSKSTV